MSLGVDEASAPRALVREAVGLSMRCSWPRAALIGRPGGCGDTVSFLPAPFVLRHKAPSNVAVDSLR